MTPASCSKLLRALGCDIQQSGDTVTSRAWQAFLSVFKAELFLGNAGTAMRPLTAALAVLSATQGGTFELSGNSGACTSAPLAIWSTRCARWAATSSVRQRRLPAPTRGGKPEPVRPIRVPACSSQFLTALLLALPWFRKIKQLTI